MNFNVKTNDAIVDVPRKKIFVDKSLFNDFVGLDRENKTLQNTTSTKKKIDIKNTNLDTLTVLNNLKLSKHNIQKTNKSKKFNKTKINLPPTINDEVSKYYLDKKR